MAKQGVGDLSDSGVTTRRKMLFAIRELHVLDVMKKLKLMDS